ncbi:uncharacterized protein FOMMEDRAFT_22043 [Fomitiporia mediterranea MF3/22]|uniref:uncharacterized protein n=1 Tax=Fomitiporia mediterranea (strain MF3/22) TaxID=694068 RepID=UPI0004407C09|nr:uncharacterized protein FOMMEDRAFT_22043 [Fomitiporia mediterranea MF3/22]EJD01678.1 hypothetical protein FOMMEDRAFT_22043 [Fomitiporia mediterranea MF3/22]
MSSSYQERRYVVPDRSDPMGGFNPRGPPFADASNPNVVRFTATHAGICTGEVIDHTNAPLYRFQSDGARHLVMLDASGGVLAKYEDGEVAYGDNFPVKGKKFIHKGAPGNTGAVLTFNGQQYEFVQEIFYAIVRTIPSADRVAIVYNYTGKPAVEMVPAGTEVAGLQEFIVFVTALMESGVMKGGKSRLGKTFQKIIPGKKCT